MKKTIPVNILIIFSSLIVLEAFCTIAFYIKDEKNPLILSESVVDFPYIYYTFIPEKKNGKTIVNIDGLYTHYNRYKPDNTIRIILMGGSTARGMFSTNAISDILERLLQKEFPKERIEVVNAGMSGYVVEQLFIFYQLILSKYSPDIVVGLNGYNDLMSIKLNRYSKVYFAPQNMQQFKVIAEGKRRKTLSGRLLSIFPSIFRMTNFIERQISTRGQYDYSTFNDAEIKKAASDYLTIIKDIHSFCNANGVIYLEFLQPIKWYVKGNKEESIKGGGVLQLIDLYSYYEKSLTDLDYGYSLTNLSNNRKELFMDDCHVSDVGNELFASAMLIPIKKELEKIHIK